MLQAPALPPPAIVSPAPREVSFGLVAGSVPRGTRRIIVSNGSRVLADRPLSGTSFSLTVEMPVVMHKAGWLAEARHDNGVIAFRGGAYVATVMTWRGGAPDELAGRISLAALRRFRSVG